MTEMSPTGVRVLKTFRVWMALGVIALVGVGVVLHWGLSSDRPAERGTTIGEPVSTHGGGMLPFEDLRDWKSYATMAAVIEVTGQEEIALPDLPATEEIDRRLSVEVEEILYTESLRPDSLTLRDRGWLVQDGVRSPFVPEGGTDLQVDERYVAALVHLPGAGDGDGWILQTSESALPLEGDVIQLPEGHHAPASVDGMTIDEFRRELSETAPHPVAEENRDVAAPERYRRVRQAERGAMGR